MENKKLVAQKNNGSDDFQSPKEAIEILIPFIKYKYDIVWECACGEGNLTRALGEAGIRVISTDIKKGEDQDFLKIDYGGDIDIIVTNPPYSLKEKFLERCYELKRPFALLMPLTALESERRQKLFRKHGIQLIIPNKRFNFTHPTSTVNGSWFATAWFCGNMNLPKDLNFVECVKTRNSEGGKN